MGFKLKKTGVHVRMPAPQFNVTALRRLFMPKEQYYRMEFGGDMEMFGRINQLPAGTVVLTHENRHLLMDPDLKIVHLDDWEPQHAYNKPVDERLRVLDELGVEYYLYVPNEDRHPINQELGMSELIRLGRFKEDYRTKASDSSMDEVEHDVIPRDSNVLYKRVR
jgi:hypothetical protein